MSSEVEDDAEVYIPAYGSSKLVDTISEYFKFLVRMYIPESHLEIPPAGGWPTITAEPTAHLPKSKFVKSLLRHLPYPAESPVVEFDHAVTIQYKSYPIDYSDKTPDQLVQVHWGGEEFLQIDVTEAKELAASLAEDDDDQSEASDDNDDDDDDDEEQTASDYDGPRTVWPDGEFDVDFIRADQEGDDFHDLEYVNMRNVICLAQGFGSGSHNICLELMHGMIHAEHQGLQPMDGVNVERYFRDLRLKFETLEHVLVPGPDYELFEHVRAGLATSDVLAGVLVADIAAQQFAQIYRDSGWPGPDYDKSACMQAIKKHCAKREEAREKCEAEVSTDDQVAMRQAALRSWEERQV